MNLYIKQHVFTWGDKFSVYDAAENEQYFVKGEVFTWGKRLHLYNLQGEEVMFIQQKMWSFLPRFRLFRHGVMQAEVIREFSWFHPRYRVEHLGWTVEGNFLGHEYQITQGNYCIATVSREFFTWGDTYQLSVMDGVDETTALAVLLVIDACLEQQNGA